MPIATLLVVTEPALTRTLRHYDAIGLLSPDHVGANGYRYYERPQLLRLQRILLLRELDLDLATINAVITGHADQVQALRDHHHDLTAARARLDKMLATIERTIADLDGTPRLSGEELFDGFHQRRARLEERLAATYGDDVRRHFATATTRTREWTPEDHLTAQQQGEQLLQRLVRLLRDGAAPNESRVLDVVFEHYVSVQQFWEPDRDSYAGLGHFYVHDPEQRAFLDTLDPRLAPWLRDAMATFATQRL